MVRTKKRSGSSWHVAVASTICVCVDILGMRMATKAERVQWSDVLLSPLFPSCLHGCYPSGSRRSAVLLSPSASGMGHGLVGLYGGKELCYQDLGCQTQQVARQQGHIQVTCSCWLTKGFRLRTSFLTTYATPTTNGGLVATNVPSPSPPPRS